MLRSAPAFCESSATEPSTSVWPQPAPEDSRPPPQTQMGRGVPQYRSRLKAQSTLFSSQLPKRPCLMCSGTQLICSLFASSSPFFSVVRMYQEGLAK